MIQRIQSVYLFLTTLLSLLFLKGSFLNFAGKSESLIKVTFGGIFRNTGGQIYELIGKSIPISVIIVLVPVLCLVTIFIFKKRKIQLWLTRSIILFAVVLLLLETYYTLYIIRQFNCHVIPGIKMFIPVLLLIFSCLAYRAIQKDERLVRSYDRLR